MTQAFLLGCALLRFGEGEEAEALVGELSAATFAADGALWLASDELSGGRVMLSRLTAEGNGTFAGHTQFALDDFIDLPDDAAENTEADIEGLDCADHYLWFTGSHSSKRARPKGNNRQKDLARLARVETEANRYLLGRVPLAAGEPVKSIRHPERPQETLTAARLASAGGSNVLIDALREDPHLGPFLRMQHGQTADDLLPLASKENGFDIEGLAVFDQRLFLGLRGPVLRGWATLLEIEPIEQDAGRLALAEIASDTRRYRKHFINLDGLGIRELARDGDDLLILAGPTMTLEGTQRFYRLREARRLDNDGLTDRRDGRLVALFDLPPASGGDNAEGFAAMPWLGRPGLLVVYDGPLASRCPASGAVYGDVFRLDG